MHLVSLSESVLEEIPLRSFLSSLNLLSPAMYRVVRISIVHLDEKMENASAAKPKRKRVKKAVSEPIVIEEVVVEVAYEDDDIVIEDVH